jgi:transcription termination/antitermination protein NusA
VLVLDEGKKQALVIVSEQNFALAIGKQGLNVRLANKLVDWNIDVKTEAQFGQMDIAAETKKAVSALFGEIKEEISRISELPGISQRIVELLKKNKIELIEEIVSLNKEEIEGLEGVTEVDAKEIMKIIEDNVMIVEEEGEVEAKTDRAPTEGETTETEVAGGTEAEGNEEEETYECPVCGASVTPSMANCPKCGVGLSFEDVEEGDEAK